MKRIALAVISLALAGCGSPDSGGPDDGGDPAKTSQPEAKPPKDAVAGGRVGLNDPAVGYYLAIESTGAAKGTNTVAVVGNLGDAWRVEMEPSQYPGFVIGLVVDKASGRVTRAVMGHPGQKGQEIPIAEGGESTDARPDGVKEEVAIAIGRFAATKRFESSGTTTWTGTEGELKDVLLKSSSDKTGPYELAKMPHQATLDAGGTEITVTKLVYTDGSERWSTEEPVTKALNYGLFKTTVSGPISWTTLVTAVKTDHEPQLIWD